MRHGGIPIHAVAHDAYACGLGCAIQLPVKEQVGGVKRLVLVREHPVYVHEGAEQVPTHVVGLHIA